MRYFRYFLCFSICSLQISEIKSEVLSGDCKAGETSGPRRVPGKCDEIFTCNAGHTFYTKCPKDLWYDMNNHWCDWQSNVNCKDEGIGPSSTPSTSTTKPIDPDEPTRVEDPNPLPSCSTQSNGIPYFYVSYPNNSNYFSFCKRSSSHYMYSGSYRCGENLQFHEQKQQCLN